MGPSVVSLVCSWVSEGPEPATDGSERMVFGRGVRCVRSRISLRWFDSSSSTTYVDDGVLRPTPFGPVCKTAITKVLSFLEARSGQPYKRFAFGGGRLGLRHHEKRGSVDRALGRCFLSVRCPGGACGTVDGVAGAFLGL